MSGVPRGLATGVLVLALQSIATASPGRETDEHSKQEAPAGRIAALVESLEDLELAALVEDALVRNPGVAKLRARAAAADRSASRAGKWPDPVAGVTAFVSPPETRVGPQRLAVTLSQGIPWGDGPGLDEAAARHGAAAVEAQAETLAIELVTEMRRIYHELAFLAAEERVLVSFRSHLKQHEEVSRARYATGVGPGQGVVKLQAEMTRVETDLVSLASQRASLESRANALRDRPDGTPLPSPALSEVVEVSPELEELLGLAEVSRPELREMRAEMDRTAALAERAGKNRRPDFRVGLTWAMVDPREDAPGRLAPPPGNGRDVFGIVGSMSLPLWRKRLAAGVESATLEQTAAAEAYRAARAAVRGEVAGLTRAIPLHWRRIRLLDDLLVVQAEEALESAKAGYVTGSLNALDLLDAEHVLFEARTAVARATADYLISLAELEGALGGPIPRTAARQRSES